MANNKLKGYLSKKHGQNFETMIEDALEDYKRLELAYVSKTPEPMRIIKSLHNGQFVCCFKSAAEPDFKGVLLDGRCIIFDAKHTDKDRIQQGCITEEQWKVFDEYEKLNALCYVVVSLRFEKFYRIPWNKWKSMKGDLGHKYMNEDDLKGYEVKFDGFKVRVLDGIEVRD